MNIGYLGFGSMGSAVAEAFAKYCGEVKDGSVVQYAYAPHQDKLRARAAEIGAVPCASAQELVRASDMVILACKPYQAEDVLSGVKDALAGKALVSLVNAWFFADFKRALGERVRVQCIMPSIPMKIKSGVVLLAEENDLTADERALLRRLCEASATVIELPEEKIPAATALCGCGPAFFYMAIEAMGDAGVKNGLQRRMAYELAAAAMVGAGSMVLADRTTHPGAMKDAVCSPAGTTIRGVAALEEAGMRNAFIKAVEATLH
ncbi:MAG: pyrroline-5-carboxylate reductase [Oscillospiraceae bacterium]|nr:pyrroline-5-carboxylate reductase [Oscillospiraceae bacterium]